MTEKNHGRFKDELPRSATVRSRRPRSSSPPSATPVTTGDRPRAVHRASDRGGLAPAMRRPARRRHPRRAAQRRPRETATTSAELRNRFGVRIGRLVETVSDDPSSRDYKARKGELRARDGGNFTKPTSAPNSLMTAPASPCCAESPGISPRRSSRRRAQPTRRTRGHRDSRRRRKSKHRTREAEQASSSHNLSPLACDARHCEQCRCSAAWTFIEACKQRGA